MNIKKEMCLLWRHLKIQDKEMLIVPWYDKESQSNKFIVGKISNNQFIVEILDEMPDLSDGKPFHIIQQIGSDKKYRLPTVKDIVHDEKLDY